MPVGAVLAVWFVMVMTDSNLADIGGPVDVIVFFGIAAMGAVGGAILVYTVERLVLRRSSRAPE
jgi:threonine aldolase